MMKSLYFFCSHPAVYLTELPVLILLAVTAAYNNFAEGVLKYYPLILLLILFSVFILVYFFRYISIDTKEIKHHGIFSSQDSAEIDANKTLYISISPMRRMKLELYGDAGEVPAFEWMKAEDVIHRDICLFRGKALGGKKSALMILKYFALDSAALEGCFEEGFSYEDERIKVNTQKNNEVLQLRVNFKIKITDVKEQSDEQEAL